MIIILGLPSPIRFTDNVYVHKPERKMKNAVAKTIRTNRASDLLNGYATRLRATIIPGITELTTFQCLSVL